MNKLTYEALISSINKCRQYEVTPAKITMRPDCYAKLKEACEYRSRTDELLRGEFVGLKIELDPNQKEPWKLVHDESKQQRKSKDG